MLCTLLTDFGSDSSYVAQMKALLLEARPQQAIVDISHECPPQDLRAAAWLLYSFVQGLPDKERVHICVVDPGVGSSRAILYVKSRGQHFLAPDNGCLSYLLESDPGAEVRAMPAPPAWASRTFHGRDYFVPLALQILAGDSPPGKHHEALHTFWLEPTRDSRGLEGEVLFVDHFGNMITALRVDHIADLRVDRIADPNMDHITDRDLQNLHFEFGGQRLPCRACYADCDPGELAVIAGSSGHFELACRDGSAYKQLKQGGTLRLYL